MVFDSVGKHNTEQALKLAVAAAKAQNIDTIVVASKTGDSVEKLLQFDVAGLNIVCVTHVNGFKEPGVQEMSKEARAKLLAAGVQVVTTTHVLSGAERGLSKKFSGVYPIELIANALRMFGQGVKVCVEVAVMALDCGTIEHMKPVVVLGGTGNGQDTAVVMRTAHASSILDCKIDEIICKPSL